MTISEQHDRRDATFAEHDAEMARTLTGFGAIGFVTFFCLALYCMLQLRGADSTLQSALLALGAFCLVLAAWQSGRVVLICSDASQFVGPNEMRAFVTRIFIAAVVGLAVVSFASILPMFRPAMVVASLDKYRDDARLLFGIDDLAQAKMTTFAKSIERTDAEFLLGDRTIKVTIQPVVKAVAAAAPASGPERPSERPSERAPDPKAALSGLLSSVGLAPDR